jgi:hypothetical protein
LTRAFSAASRAASSFANPLLHRASPNNTVNASETALEGKAIGKHPSCSLFEEAYDYHKPMLPALLSWKWHANAPLSRPFASLTRSSASADEFASVIDEPNGMHSP